MGRYTFKFNGEHFAVRVMRWRNGTSLRLAAQDVGISAATLSRIECGNVPDLMTFMTLCMVMGADPRDFVYASEYTGGEG